MTQKTLDAKLARIVAGEYTASDFIIADAKDGDMALGLGAPGPSRRGEGYASRADYLANMSAMSESGLVDIMLMSASSAEQLQADGAFEQSSVTPAVRMNDTTDIWSARHSRYRETQSLPFATADLDSVTPLCNLGLYSMTFSNDVEADRRSLLAYRDFRLAARTHEFQHFLEIFNPAFDIGIAAEDIGFYINDMILKAVAGVVSRDRPLFLKIQFNGAAAMRELSSYDPAGLVVGILGGSKGTTRDTFELAAQAEQSGARVALFGRKINLSESPLDLVRLLREVIEQKRGCEEAVREYHRILGDAGTTAQRPLAEDLLITDAVLQR